MVLGSNPSINDTLNLQKRQYLMKAVPRGGRVRFAVESKSFEILIDESGDKLRGCIWERCKGITSWIRFGDVSLSRSYRLVPCMGGGG